METVVGVNMDRVFRLMTELGRWALRREKRLIERDPRAAAHLRATIVAMDDARARHELGDPDADLLGWVRRAEAMIAAQVAEAERGRALWMPSTTEESGPRCLKALLDRTADAASEEPAVSSPSQAEKSETPARRPSRDSTVASEKARGRGCPRRPSRPTVPSMDAVVPDDARRSSRPPMRTRTVQPSMGGRPLAGPTAIRPAVSPVPRSGVTVRVEAVTRRDLPSTRVPEIEPEEKPVQSPWHTRRSG